MVFSFSSQSTAQQQSTDQSQQQPSMDSISLGQLKAMAPQAPKAKQSYYDFRYDDQDTTFDEIEEFYSYAELPQIDENYRAWQGSFEGSWIEASVDRRKKHMELLLETLEHKDGEVRFTNARRLFYLLQGVFAETISPEQQLFWIVENCKMFRGANGVAIVKDAITIATAKHDLLHTWTDIETRQFNLSLQDKADFIEEVCTELSIYLGMLYQAVEVLKGYDDFAEELMSLDPPLPIFLFNLLAGLRDKSPKGYPVKKLVLTIWKCLLACLGGSLELARAKLLRRELESLPTADTVTIAIKSSPLDLETFRQETAVKYPTFVPPTSESSSNPATGAFNSKLSSVDMPIPVRPHHHHHDATMLPTSHLSMQPHQAQPVFSPRNPPPPTTPAPSPPPSPLPKPKKQQYQTDQSRPFLFPFSRKNFESDERMVPFAIDEADNLYGKHMHVSAQVWQTWRVREDYIRDDAGLGLKDDQQKVLADLTLLDEKILSTERAIESALREGKSVKKLRDRKEDLTRLKRVEHIYAAILPHLNTCITQLLKMLLATVAAPTGAGQNPQSATSVNFPSGIPPAVDQPPPQPMNLEEMDVLRHREITSKAVSAILLLTIKWFKVSHAMKFHHLGLLLLDSNCPLLILKMFGLQEVSTSITSKCDSLDHNFFRYCQLTYSSMGHHAGLEQNHRRNAMRQSVSRVNVYPNGQKVEEEIELINEFSWRNFFASVNFVKIMQKLTKRRSHRIWLLVQYKSSAILKRILKVSHALLQLHVLKLIKSQVPYCGRKWRQTNMKVITQIYMNCHPDLRDEWLTGCEIEDPTEAVGQEQALRNLVKYYNSKRYGNGSVAVAVQAHRRSTSMSGQGLDGLYLGQDLSGFHRPAGTPNTDMDVFPPPRSHAPDPSIFLPYIPEDIAFEEEYEEYLSDLSLYDEHTVKYEGEDAGAPELGYNAWNRLASLPNIADNISDSESVISIGELGEENRGDERDSMDENRNDWEHMSPKTMAALPKSPAGGSRRSSSGSHLRPVLPFDLDEGSAIEDDEADSDEPEMGPMPIEGASFGAAEGGRGVDEVEFMYHE